MPSAKVVATEVATNRARDATTNNEGYYVIPSLRPASYQLTVTATGFRAFIQARITLLADQSLTANVQLELGLTTEKITVSADAIQVDTTTPTLRQVVDQQRIVDLPLNGRNAAELTLLVPGAVNSPGGNADQGPTKTFPGAQTISTNGSRQNQISYNLDGGNYVDEYTNVNQPFPFPDALQEFSVQTSNYSAQYGQSSGAVVNVLTKSGTNSFHGNVFGFHRNKYLNARNFFQAGRDELKRTQFGFTVGGPVLVPRLYNGRDRTFFFGGYQGTRIRNIQRGLSGFVPTDANRLGDFSALLDARNPDNPLGSAVKTIDPLTRQAFPGNIVPPSRLDPAALRFLEFIPRASGNGRLQYDRPARNDYNEGLVRLDHSFTDNDRLTVRYVLNDFLSASGFDGQNLLTLTNFSGILSQNGLIHQTHVFNPGLLNDFRFSYSRVAAARGQPQTVPTVVDFGVKGIWQPPERGIELIQVSGFFSVSASPTATFKRNNFVWGDDVKLVRGRHTVALGGVFERTRVDVDNHSRQHGQFRFTSDVTNNSLVSLLLGKLRLFEQGAGEYRYSRATIPAVYFQDTFRASQRLTLDFGLRWEPFIPWPEKRGRIEVFEPDAFVRGERSRAFLNAPPGLFFPGFGDRGPKDGTTADWNNFAPRVGFAYDLFGNAKTSIRGGAGIFYEQRLQGLLMIAASDVSPFSPQFFVTEPQGSFSNPLLGLVNPYPAPFPPPEDAAFPRPVRVQCFAPGVKFLTPTVYQWNLAIEHQLSSNWLGRLAYVGSAGRHLKSTLNLNNAVYIPGSPLGTDQRRRFQEYADILQDTREGNSNHNGLQVGLEKRFVQGITLLGHYTYSKTIDDQSSLSVDGAQTPGHALPFDDPSRRKFQRGPSDFDGTHRFVTSYIWRLPGLRYTDRWVRGAFGNWQITGVLQAQSGRPFTIMAGQDRSQSGLGSDRGVFLGGLVKGSGGCGATEAPCVGFLNRGAFGLPEIGTFGNVGKGALRGPNSWTWDMGFFKDFPFAERYKVQFRVEYFNIFNHANFGSPASSLSAAGFGGIRSAGDPRIGQLALKVFF